MRVVYDLIAQVCRSDTTDSSRPSGTGKGTGGACDPLQQPRASRPFIKVNCGALPESVIESELFGHVKGAFTGRHRNEKGRFELAHGGQFSG